MARKRYPSHGHVPVARSTRTRSSVLPGLSLTRFGVGGFLFGRGGHAAGGEFAGPGNFCFGQERDGARSAFARNWLGCIPIHERQIVIGSVLGVGDETSQNVAALIDGESLQG